LRLHRRGLDAVARALLEKETLDGDEVSRLVDDAMGRKAGGYRKVRRADGTIIEVKPPTENGGRKPRKAVAAPRRTSRKSE
jgi:hypothetical protein